MGTRHQMKAARTFFPRQRRNKDGLGALGKALKSKSTSFLTVPMGNSFTGSTSSASSAALTELLDTQKSLSSSGTKALLAKKTVARGHLEALGKTNSCPLTDGNAEGSKSMAPTIDHLSSGTKGPSPGVQHLKSDQRRESLSQSVGDVRCGKPFQDDDEDAIVDVEGEGDFEQETAQISDTHSKTPAAITKGDDSGMLNG